MPDDKKPLFLDVDSTIVEKNLRFMSDSDDKELDKLFGSPSWASKLVTPSPGFCVKTKEVGTGVKVFVNICKTDAIPPPKDISVRELQELLDSDDPGDYKVPMSLGDIRTEPDKKGEVAKVCDVAIHPDFFEKVEEYAEFKSFFLAIVFQGIEDKYNLACEEEKITLINRKHFGKLQAHRIQQREIAQKMAEGSRKSLLDEVGGKTEQKKVVIETLSSTENVMREPNYRLYKKKDGQNCIYGEFQLPDVISSKELTLDIGEDRILLESKARSYLLDIFVPYIVKQKSCSSSFNKSTKVLTVTMPLVGG
ncbi:hypothetical protein JTB14_005116 [Gonioctena quinquepunctata]|nr:hypothetical protein JTB14_005116 [Gonioctena quinquepunctata]